MNFIQRKNKTITITLVFGLCALVMACTPLNFVKKNDQDIKHYEISVPENLKKKNNPTGPSIVIYPIKTSAVYNSPRIAYQLQKYDISYYAQNEWADTPGQLLLPVFLASMESSGLFHSTISISSSAISDLALDVELQKLIHEYDENDSKVRMIVRMQLIDLKRRNILASETLDLLEPAPSNDPLGAVKGTNQLVNQLIQASQSFVKSTLQ